MIHGATLVQTDLAEKDGEQVGSTGREWGGSCSVGSYRGGGEQMAGW